MTYYSICFCCDKNYYKHLQVSVKSLLDNNRDIPLKIYVINDDFSNDEVYFLRKLIGSYKKYFVYINNSDWSYSNLKTTKQFSKAIYYRLSIPYLIDEDLVLYLDSDVVVNGSLSSLFSVDLEKNVLGAVEDIGDIDYKSLNIDCELGYFNSGVMLINTKEWKLNNITQKALLLLENKEINFSYPDQDALNIILVNRWKKLNPIYNQQASFFYKKLQKKGYYIFGQEFSNSKKYPLIIHYSGSKKPWHTSSTHPYRKKYWFYHSEKKINKHLFDDFSIKNYFKYVLKIMLGIKL